MGGWRRTEGKELVMAACQMEDYQKKGGLKTGWGLNRGKMINARVRKNRQFSPDVK